MLSFKRVTKRHAQVLRPVSEGRLLLPTLELRL